MKICINKLFEHLNKLNTRKKHLLLLTLILGITAATYAQGNCLEFDGTNDIVIVQNYPKPTNKITVEAWAYAESLANYGSVAMNWNTGTRGQFTMGLGGGGNKKMHVSVTESDDDNIQLEDPQNFPIGVWVHLALVADGSLIHFYKNGIEIGTPLSYDGTLKTSLAPFGIGAKPNGDATDGIDSWWHGKIDDVRIWNVARTADEIRENMCKELIGTETGLVAYYKLNEKNGTNANDETVNNNDGTLHNMAGDEWAPSTAFNTWTGTTDTDWHTTTNWSSGFVPEATDNVGIVDISNQPATGADASCKILSIGTGATLTVSPSTILTVSGNIFVSGTFDVKGTVNQP